MSDLLPVRLKYVQCDGGYGHPVYEAYEAVYADGHISPVRHSLEQWSNVLKISIDDVKKLTANTSTNERDEMQAAIKELHKVIDDYVLRYAGGLSCGAAIHNMIQARKNTKKLS